jgi:hypothetical protein
MCSKFEGKRLGEGKEMLKQTCDKIGAQPRGCRILQG